jgi:hypothetical protein
LVPAIDEGAFGAHLVQKRSQCIAILYIGAGDPANDGQAKRIGHQMALAPFAFLAGVEPTRPSRFGRPCRLAIDDDGTRRCVASFRVASLHDQKA